MAKFWQDLGFLSTMDLTDKLLVGNNSDGSTQYTDLQTVYNKISQVYFADTKPSVIAAGSVLTNPNSLTCHIAPAGTYTLPSGNVTLTGNINFFFWDFSAGWTWQSFDVSVKDGSVETVKIADRAVTTDKIADSSISSSKIAEGAETIKSWKEQSYNSGSIVSYNGSDYYALANTTPLDIPSDTSSVWKPRLSKLNTIFNRNLLKNSRLLAFDKPNNNFSAVAWVGSPTYTVEDNLFGSKQLRVIVPIGARWQLKSGISIESGSKYSGGFFYKQVSGTIKPIIYEFASLTLNNLSSGIQRETILQDGWVFYARENATCSANFSSNTDGFLIDVDNRSGTNQVEVLITLPSFVIGESIAELTSLNGYDHVVNYLQTLAESTNSQIITQFSNRNLFKNSRLLYFTQSGSGFSVNNQNGSPTYTVEDNPFGSKQLRVIVPIGARWQLKSGISIESGNKYSGGFFYKQVSGTVKPFLYNYNGLAPSLSAGTVRDVSVGSGWNFYARENALCSGNYTDANNGFLIDVDNRSGTNQIETIITLPSFGIGETISSIPNGGYDFAISYLDSLISSNITSIATINNTLANIDGDWNYYTDSGLFLVNRLGNSGVRTQNQNGTPTFAFEKNVFGGQQCRITCTIGQRAQLIAPFNPEANQSYSFGFFYKVISGTKTPIDSAFILQNIAGNVSVGSVNTVDVKEGWKFYKRTNFSYNQSSSNTSGLYIDVNNITGSETIEILIALPTLVKNSVLQTKYPNSTFDAIINLFSRVVTLESSILTITSDWNSKVVGMYGDSITAINNGDYTSPILANTSKWGTIVANYYNFSKLYARGAGGQKYAWGTVGGSVVFVNSTTGQYDSRNDAYNYDNYAGTIPVGCIKTRGAFCSWDRITKMFPASIKETIHAVIIKGATNDAIDVTDVSFVANSTIDTEWAASSYYATYAGDYNINTLKGGIASTVMKLQAWMPQAVIIIATPLSGRGTTGQISTTLTTDETTKSIYVRDVAKLMSIPVIDVNANCGINTLNRTTYITDGVHPYNVAGNKMLARAVIQEMKGIFPNI